jgi:hypothetical protein
MNELYLIPSVGVAVIVVALIARFRAYLRSERQTRRMEQAWRRLEQ